MADALSAGPEGGVKFGFLDGHGNRGAPFVRPDQNRLYRRQACEGLRVDRTDARLIRQGVCLWNSEAGVVDEMPQLLHSHLVQGSYQGLDDATRSFLRAAENPYALLDLIDEDELVAAPGKETAQHEALRRTENPYATHEVFPESALTEPTQDVSKVRVARTAKEPNPARLQEELSLGANSLGHTRVSMVDYNRRGREILLPYLPMDRGSRILPKPYRDFLAKHSGSPEERAVALEELEQYALPLADGFKPVFNREREDHLLAKLDGISRRIQRRMEQR